MWKQLEAAAFRYCPVVYLCISLPIVLFQVFVLPPFQGADEAAHFLRVAHLTNGHVIGERFGEFSSGGPVPPAANMVHPPFAYMLAKPAAKLDGSKLTEARQLFWRGAERPSTFETSVIYPPLMYLPAIVGLKIGQVTGKSVLDSIYMARFLTALSAIAISTVGLALAGPGRATMFVLLCFPMTLHLYSYVTQDALLISLAALIAGLLSYAYASGKRFRLSSGLLLSMIVGCMVAARTPLFPIIAIFLLPLFAPQIGTVNPKWHGDRRVLYLALSTAIAISWVLLGAAPVKVPFKLEDGISISGQLDFILGHMTHIPSIAFNTLEFYAIGYLQQIVGVLGNLDTPLPQWYYGLAVAPVFAAMLGDYMRPQNSMRMRDAWLILGLCVVVAAAIFAAQYLSWTPVGASRVEGVQGRYFIPVLLLCAICVPCRLRARGGEDEFTAAVTSSSWLIVYGYAFYGVWLVPRVIFSRFIG
ncbi:DUF2142 domain-containing protein [Camelimonas lactis]|uniref:Putative membrane protein DUF2142 n=1 Tax=Camelimonas lactis TaxID=659006 RepID=A0A4V2RXK8_9HYPH|nr:DUF2142 domain-containing protein [Camelimonas lactis]TCO14496.1 putative membrane protein DUF2142 [Camelimonas lactis]